MTTEVQFFSTKFGLEIASVELLSAGLPVTQAAAEQLANRIWKGTKAQRRHRKLQACYSGKN